MSGARSVTDFSARLAYRVPKQRSQRLFVLFFPGAHLACVNELPAPFLDHTANTPRKPMKPNIILNSRHSSYRPRMLP
jgi:hypothetical protein